MADPIWPKLYGRTYMAEPICWRAYMPASLYGQVYKADPYMADPLYGRTCMAEPMWPNPRPNLYGRTYMPLPLWPNLHSRAYGWRPGGGLGESHVLCVRPTPTKENGAFTFSVCPGRAAVMIKLKANKKTEHGRGGAGQPEDVLSMLSAYVGLLPALERSMRPVKARRRGINENKALLALVFEPAAASRRTVSFRYFLYRFLSLSSLL